MRVPRQHLQRLMTGYRLDFHDTQVGKLKETAGRLVPEVMEAKVFKLCLFARILH